MKLLVTGAAGFIGYALAERLCRRGDQVIGIDNLNDYYDVAIKQARLARLGRHENFSFQQLDLADSKTLDALFAAQGFDRVLNMAAQAGVRHSLIDPYAYVQSNVMGHLVVLEAARLLPRLPASGLLPDDPELVARLQALMRGE